MAGMNEAFTRDKIDAQLKDQGWNVLNTNAVALRKAEAALLALLARAIRSEPGLDVRAEEAVVA